MAQSLRARLNGNGEQFLGDIKKYGDMEAMQKWSKKLSGYHDYIGLRKFVIEETGDETFGLNPTLSEYRTKGIYEILCKQTAVFANYVAKDVLEKEAMRAELDAYHQNGKEQEEKWAILAEGFTDSLRALQ